MSAPAPGAPRSSLGDATLAHLRAVVDAPDVSGTRYELLEPVGRGGMGAVWRALDRELEREIALKVIFEVEGGASGQLAARLVQEAKVLARLEHPGIVPVHDVGVLPDGRAYCAMKLVRGRRLDELVRAGISEAERFRVFARIGEAVAFAHARGVLHRDLKPGNVMVGEFGEVLVLDWGLAKLRDGRVAGPFAEAAPAIAPAAGTREPLTGHGTRLGTPGFMAPEQERGETAVDARADVYSLGVLLRFLWSGGGEAVRLPRPLRAIADKATAERAADRYATVLDLAADVARFQAGEAVSALPEGLLGKAARLYRKTRVAIWLVVAYFVARVAAELARRWIADAG